MNNTNNTQPAAQDHLKAIEQIYYQIFCAQLNEHRYNRLCKYEKENILINIALPLLGKLVEHFSVPTSATIMVCDVVFALLNHHIKRGTIPTERLSPLSLHPVKDLLKVHGGNHISFQTLLYILETGTKQLLDTLGNQPGNNNSHNRGSPNTGRLFPKHINSRNGNYNNHSLWFIVDRVEFFNYMISKQTSIDWQGSCTVIMDAFGVAAGESVPRSVENVLLNGHAHLLASYCALAIDCTGIPPIVNGHHFSPDKIYSILSMIDIVISSTEKLIHNLPLPKGYVDAFRRCKIQCEQNLKVQRDLIRLGNDLHEKYSSQMNAMQNLGIAQENLKDRSFRNHINSSFWENDFRRSMLVLDPLPDEQCLILNDIKNVQVLPRLCYGYINWDDYLFRNYCCFKNDGSSRVAMDFLAETNNIQRQNAASNNANNTDASIVNNDDDQESKMYGKNSNIFKVLRFDPDFSHPIFRGKGLKRYTIDIKVATHIDDFHHTNVPQHRVGSTIFENVTMDLEEDDERNVNTLGKKFLSVGSDIQMSGDDNSGDSNDNVNNYVNGSAWTADEIDYDAIHRRNASGRGKGNDKNNYSHASRHLFLLWNTFSDENFYFRGCWFQRAKKVKKHYSSVGSKFHEIIATVEVNEEFYKWYEMKTKAGEIDSSPNGIYMTNPKFGGYSSILAVIESLAAPNKYTTSRKPVHVDDRIGTPSPKDNIWPKVPNWLINLVCGRENSSYQALKNIEIDIPIGIIARSANNNNNSMKTIIGDSNVLGTTLEEIHEGLNFFNTNENNVTIRNITTGSRKAQTNVSSDKYLNNLIQKDNNNNNNTNSMNHANNGRNINYVGFDINFSSWGVHQSDFIPIEIQQVSQIGSKRRKLYATQRAAIWSSLFRKITMLIGPPGTGKTDTVIEIINILANNLCRYTKQRMLVVAHSNRALDQLYEAIIELYDILSRKNRNNGHIWVPHVVRIGGNYERVSRDDIVNADIVCMTCTGCATRRFSMKWEFDTVIVEEAAKITQPEALPFLSYNPSRIILVGDHLQLSPVVMDPGVKERTWLEDSLFQVLLRKGVQPILLNCQGRATKPICDMYRWRYPSLFDLPHVENTAFRNLDAIITSEIFPPTLAEKFRNENQAIPPLFIDMDYTMFNISKSIDEKNVHEASFIKAFVDHILHDKNKINAKSISVLTPYKNQKQYLKKDVFEIFDDDEYDSDDGEKNIDIATTDEYQGLQNDIILVSLVSTGKRPSPHLSNQKRLNVLTSRSRVMFILIGKKETFQVSTEWASVLNKVQFLSEKTLRKHMDLQLKNRPVKAPSISMNSILPIPIEMFQQEETTKTAKTVVPSSSFTSNNNPITSNQMNIIEMAQYFLTHISKYTDKNNTTDERVKRILAMLIDLNLSQNDINNEIFLKEKILEAEEVCKKEMVEFGKIIFEKIENHASRKDVKHIHKILAMFLALERKVRVRLVNKENDDANEFFLVDKIKEAESLLLTNDNNDNDVEKVEKEKKKTLPPHILKAAKALLPKIQSLAKNKSEQRIKKILAILLDMEESQITLVCENEKVLAKRVKEAEGILNDDHWTKRVRKVTLGE